MTVTAPPAISPIERIQAAAQTRVYAGECLARILDEADRLSEKECAEKIRAALAANPELYPEGWYRPPPGGIAVLAADDKNFDRLKFDSLRKETYWPRDDIRITPESIVLVYASPVHKAQAAIGDIARTHYRGTNPRYREHLRAAQDVLKEIADFAAPGKTFSDLCSYARVLFEKSRLTNDRALLTTRPEDAPVLNLGHTLPWTFDSDPAPGHAAKDKDMLSLFDSISKARIFVNSNVSFEIPKTCAFTIEARLESLDDPSLPNNMWHMIVTFINGRKEVYT